MYWQRKNGKFSFVYYDRVLKKNIRLAQHLTPAISDEEEADAFCKRWNAEHDATRERIRRRTLWQKKYIRFEELKHQFIEYKAESAPRTIEAYCQRLEHYVFPFFLMTKNENNPALWHYHFEDFRSSLKWISPLTGSTRRLSVSAQNSIIMALNSWMEFLYVQKAVEVKHECRYFSSHLVHYRDERAVLPKEIQERLYDKLFEMQPLAAAFFWIALKTGLRINEEVGLSLNDFFSEPEAGDIEAFSSLKEVHLNVRGVLCLESQPKLTRKSPRDNEGSVPRIPLKGKRKISIEVGRIIPVCDGRAYQWLCTLYDEQRKALSENKWTDNPSDYLLFQDLTATQFGNLFAEAQRSLKLTRTGEKGSVHPLYTHHCLRHTFTTELVETVGPLHAFSVCRMILGHSSVKTTQRYMHMNSKLKQQLRVQKQLQESVRILGNKKGPENSEPFLFGLTMRESPELNVEKR